MNKKQNLFTNEKLFENYILVNDYFQRYLLMLGVTALPFYTGSEREKNSQFGVQVTLIEYLNLSETTF